MDVTTGAEQLFFVTVNLQGTYQGQSSAGTGFIYSVELESGGSALFLVTNKHVLEGGTDGLKATLLQRTADGRPAYGTAASLELGGVVEASTPHPDPKVDVVVSPFGQAFDALTTLGQPPFYRALPSPTALTREKARGRDARGGRLRRLPQQPVRPRQPHPDYAPR